MKNIKFSVLMSIYHKENPSYLEQAMRSIYHEQTLKPTEIVLVEDGKLTDKLYEVIASFKKSLGDILTIIPLEENMGLGNALKIGIEKCKYEYIARMDTDDVAYPNRFKKQIGFLKEHPDVDVLGTYIEEFVGDIDNSICIKDAPLENIKDYIKFRSPINHPTVVYKKSKVLEAGNYMEIPLNEDIYLWARMIAKGFNFTNIPEPLLHFRTTDDTYQRRGGMKYVKSEFRMQKELLKLKLISLPNFIFNVASKTVVRLMPNGVRKIIYLKLLRK